MFYFKRVNIEGATTTQLEAALRKAALKRTSPLDFASAISNVGTDKYFIGYESKKGLTFTRIKASPEKLLPKLIIKLPLAANECYYEVRFGILSMMIFLMFTLPWILGVALFISGKTDVEGFLSLTGFYVFYWMLLVMEFRLTKWRVKRAVLNYNTVFSQV